MTLVHHCDTEQGRVTLDATCGASQCESSWFTLGASRDVTVYWSKVLRVAG